MKISKYFLLVIIVSILIFFIPFGWLKPGEMDLGGDSSRLYFYDPLNYLKNYSLFGISPSGAGAENIGYFSIPLVVILAGLKFVLGSPTILISAFHGFSLSVAFLACYLVILELLKEKSDIKNSVSELSALLGGLFYIFSPSPILGWDKALMTRNHIFVDPLMFYLLLRYFKTSRISYLVWSLLTTFIFSANFSFAAAPPFFAFYPLSIAFLLTYTIVVLQKSVVWKHIIFSLFAFIGLQSFHLLPQISSTFSPGSVIYSAVFSNEGKFGRGLSYFTAIASSIKASINLLALPHWTLIDPVLWLMIIVPLTVIIALILVRKEGPLLKKTFLLCTIYFLIALFFATANITKVGLAIYKNLFILPGFSIFRNFYGQWVSVYLFSYSLLFGLSLGLVLPKIKWHKVVSVALGLYFVIIAWPFINGDLVNKVLWQSKDMRIFMRMDPDYENAVSFVRSLPVDGKILTLPFSDPGYQILAGKDKGAYQGPSTIAYLTGKKDFVGFAELGIFADLFVYAAKHDDYQSIQKIFSLLNIRYIFYNADPRVYDETFPGFPYEYVRTFMPPDQASYKQFLLNLDISLLKQFGDKYFIYEIRGKNYLPRLYVPQRIENWNASLPDNQAQLDFLNIGEQTAFLNYPENPGRIGITVYDNYLFLQKKSPILDFLVKRRPPTFPSPYISRKLSWIFYPLVIWDEKRDLNSFQKADDTFIDRLLFYAEKRLNELEKWKDEVSVLGNIDNIKDFSKRWKEPQFAEFGRYKEYNYWEISLVRYHRSLIELINLLDGKNSSIYSLITKKVELKKALVNHEQKLKNSIKDSQKLTFSRKQYLLRLIYGLFEDITLALDLRIPDITEAPYSVDHVTATGIYETYVTEGENSFGDTTLTLNGQKLFPKSRVDSKWQRFSDVTISQLSSQSALLKVTDNANLVKDTLWQAGEYVETGVNMGSLVSVSGSSDRSGGLIRDISGWQPGELYLVSFAYLTHGKSYRLKFFEQGGKNTLTSVQLIDDLLRSDGWKTYQAIVPSGEFARFSFIQVVKEADDPLEELVGSTAVSKIDIKNLAVVEVPLPNIVLRKAGQSESRDLKNPSITFARVNPTKYLVRVRGATAPYFLVFLEAFHSRWRLVAGDTVGQPAPKLSPRDLMNIDLVQRRIRADVSKLIGYIGTVVVRLLLPQIPVEEEIIATHFGGNVSETSHRRVFLDPQTFKTWGENSVAFAKHFQVNGYANAWYVEPADVGSKKDYDLILEFTTQKYFYFGLGVSLFTLGGLIVYGLAGIKKLK